MEDKNILDQPENPNDKLGIGLTLLSFCFPWAGAIIYFSNKNKMPNKAKSACHAALWGGGISLFLSMITEIAEKNAH